MTVEGVLPPIFTLGLVQGKQSAAHCPKGECAHSPIGWTTGNYVANADSPEDPFRYPSTIIGLGSITVWVLGTRLLRTRSEDDNYGRGTLNRSLDAFAPVLFDFQRAIQTRVLD